MNDFILTSSSTADMKFEYFEERKIPYIKFHFNLDGKEYEDDLGQTIPYDEFYQRITNGSMPTTSLVNVSQHIDLFEKYLANGKDILHLSFSSGLSGSHNSALLAKDELLEKYPNRKIIIVDSLAASSGYGLLTDYAADMRDSGATIEEVYNWLEENKLNVNHWFFSTDLTHYKRGGRISATSAAMGTLLGICPLLNMSDEGKLVPRKKVRGKKRVITEIVSMMEQNVQNGLNYAGKCFISHSACLEDAEKVRDLIEDKFPHLKDKILINSIGTVVGAHTGTGTVALFFMGNKRID